MSDAIVREALIGVREGDPREFLLRAAVRDLRQRAGWIPSSAPEADLAPDEPPVSMALDHLLGELIAEHKHDLLRIAGEELTKAKLRVPPRWLPDVLGLRDNVTRATFMFTIGARGRWLAAKNAEWSWALAELAPDDVAKQWEEGNDQQRVVALRTMRDADPAKARAWLEEVWPKERAEQRAALIRELGWKLSLDDEPFLERALSDRSASVRELAASALTQIPGSKFVARMIALADEAVQPVPSTQSSSFWSKVKSIGKGSVQKLIIEPPAGTAGQRGQELTRLVAAVPLAHWTTRFSMTPEQLLAAASETEWMPSMVDGWRRATILQRNVAWARALIQRKNDLDDTAKVQLPQLLPPEEMLALLVDVETWPVVQLLELIPRPWPETAAKAWLANVRRAAASGSSSQHMLLFAQTLDALATGLPESLFAAASAAEWSVSGDEWLQRAWEQRIQKFNQILRIRKTIAEESRP